MTLGELIQKLEAMDPKTRMRPGFGAGRSWRGAYEQVAFEPVEEATVGEMLAHARAMPGTTIEGYKGGEYSVDLDSLVNVDRYGEYTATGVMDVWWAANVETAPLRARVAELESQLAVRRDEAAVAVKAAREERDARVALEGELAAYRRPGHDPTPAMERLLAALTTIKSKEQFATTVNDILRQAFSEVSAAAWGDALRTFSGLLEEGMHKAAAHGIPAQQCAVEVTDVIMMARTLADDPPEWGLDVPERRGDADVHAFMGRLRGSGLDRWAVELEEILAAGPGTAMFQLGERAAALAEHWERAPLNLDARTLTACARMLRSVIAGERIPARRP